MRLFGLIWGCVTVLFFITPASGATITFSDLRADAAQGVRIQPTGPDDFPALLGLSEVYGITQAFLTNSPAAPFYSGVATFDTPATTVTFDVSRVNNSGWRNPITIIGLENHKRVASTTVNLAPLGDTTQVTITAPAINQIEWLGTDWTFHPYVVDAVHITFQTPPVASVEPPVGVGNPDVGSAVPEPGSCAVFGLIGAGVLLRRTRTITSASCLHAGASGAS